MYLYLNLSVCVCQLHILIKRNIQIMLQSLMCRVHFLVCSVD